MRYYFLLGFSIDGSVHVYDSYTGATLGFPEVSDVRHAIQKTLNWIKPERVISINNENTTGLKAFDRIIVWCDGREVS